MSVEFVEKKRWLFLGLPFTFTRYVIKEDMITVDTGVFTKVENDCYMYLSLIHISEPTRP